MGKCDGDWCWLIGDQVLEVASGDIGVHKFKETIGIRFLGKGNGDWCWLVSDEVLEVSSGNVSIHKFKETIGIRFLSKSNGDWCWLISNQVLEISSGHVGVHELEESVSIRLLGKLNTVGTSWLILLSVDIIDQVLKYGVLGIIASLVISWDIMVGDWSLEIGNQLFHGTSGHVESFEGVVNSVIILLCGFLLGKGNGDWGWLVSDKVLQVSSGHVSVHELEKAISIALLDSVS